MKIMYCFVLLFTTSSFLTRVQSSCLYIFVHIKKVYCLLDVLTPFFKLSCVSTHVSFLCMFDSNKERQAGKRRVKSSVHTLLIFSHFVYPFVHKKVKKNVPC